MAEELTLQQVLRYGRAVDGDEAAFPARAEVVDGAREEFLAGPAFAEYQHRDVRRRNLLDRPAQAKRRFVGGDDALDRGLLGERGKAAVLGLEHRNPEGAIDDQLQDVDVNRLLVEVVGAVANRVQGVVAIRVTGHDDDLCLRCDREDLLQRLESLGNTLCVGRQAQVEQHDTRFVTPQCCHGLLARRGKGQRVVVQRPLQLFLHAGVVLDHQQRCLVVLCHRFVQQVTPRPGGRRRGG